MSSSPLLSLPGSCRRCGKGTEGVTTDDTLPAKHTHPTLTTTLPTEFCLPLPSLPPPPHAKDSESSMALLTEYFLSQATQMITHCT